MVYENHELRDTGIELESIDVFGKFFDGLVKESSGFIANKILRLALLATSFRKGGQIRYFALQGDNFFKEFFCSFDTVGTSRNSLVEWTHEHFIDSEGVVAKFFDDGIWVDCVASSLGHFAAVFGHDEADVMVFLEWFVVGDDA